MSYIQSDVCNDMMYYAACKEIALKPKTNVCEVGSRK